MISLQISLIRIKFDSTFDARESNAAFVTCDSNQRWPLTFFDHTFDVAQRRFYVQCQSIPNICITSILKEKPKSFLQQIDR